MPAYLPKSFQLKASNMNIGTTTDEGSTKLSLWPRTIASGIVKTSGGTLLPGAGLLIYSAATSTTASGSWVYLGMTFTDSVTARYAVSLGALTGVHVYKFKVISEPIQS